MWPPKTASTNIPSSLDSDNLGLHKAFVTGDLFRSGLLLRVKTGRPSEAKGKAENWGTQNLGFFGLCSHKAFLPTTPVPEQKVLPQRLLPNMKENPHNITCPISNCL